MKSRVLWALGGALVSFSYVTVVGFLTLRMIGVRGGAVFGFDNSLVAITTPRPGVLEALSMAIVSCVVLFVLFFAARRRPVADHLALGLGFAVLTLLQVAVSSVIQIETYSFVRGIDDQCTLWWGGWLLKVGINPAAHLTLVMFLSLIVMSATVLQARRHAVEGCPSASKRARSASEKE